LARVCFAGAGLLLSYLAFHSPFILLSQVEINGYSLWSGADERYASRKPLYRFKGLINDEPRWLLLSEFSLVFNNITFKIKG